MHRRECLEVFYILDGMVPTWNLWIPHVYPGVDAESQRRLGWAGMWAWRSAPTSNNRRRIDEHWR